MRSPRNDVKEQKGDWKEIEEEQERAEYHSRKQGYWVGADKAGMPVRSGLARWLLSRIGIVLALILLGPKIAVAQTGDRFWGYTFAAPAFFSDSVAIPTSFGPVQSDAENVRRE